ncbi:MAG TPA: proton-conducting transporter membrane subunit [Bacteriovoracaceae bacterium]|nr:proton-conducting transporter membrane subunit [Bacteriovoracaceae bacterium]
MKISSVLMDVFPLGITFGSAVLSNFHPMNRRWQNYVIGLLAVLLVYFTVLFFTKDFQTSLAVHTFIDIRYNKISVFVALLFCGSLFLGLYPLRKTIVLTDTFLYYIAGGLGIILSNNLPTFFIFWAFQRSLPLIGFLKDHQSFNSYTGATYFIQHSMTFICFVLLMFLANSSGLLISPMTEMPANFFTWPVLILSFIIIYQAHGLLPFQSWVHDMVGNFAWYELSSLFLSRAGVLLFVQLLLPTLGQDPDAFKVVLLLLSILSSVYWSFKGISEDNLIKTTTYFYIAQASLLLTGLQADQVALKGSYLHMMVVSISGTALFSILNYIQHTFDLTRQTPHFGLAQYYPRLATLFCLFGFCMIGVPLGASFVVEDLVITGILHYQPLLGLGHIFATSLNGILFFLIFSKLFLGKNPFREVVHNKDLPLLQLTPYLLGLVLLIMIGILPFLFLEKITW